MNTHHGAIRRHPARVALVTAAIAVAGIGIVDQAPVAGAAGNSVVDWNATAGQAACAGCLSPANDPLHEARMYAIAHIAIHDALNAIDRRYEPYTYDARDTYAPKSSQVTTNGATLHYTFPAHSFTQIVVSVDSK